MPSIARIFPSHLPAMQTLELVIPSHEVRNLNPMALLQQLRKSTSKKTQKEDKNMSFQLLI
jgi:hypothetical protein